MWIRNTVHKAPSFRTYFDKSKYLVLPFRTCRPLFHSSTGFARKKRQTLTLAMQIHQGYWSSRIFFNWNLPGAEFGSDATPWQQPHPHIDFSNARPGFYTPSNRHWRGFPCNTHTGNQCWVLKHYSGRTKYSACASKLSKLSEEYLCPQKTQKAAVFFIRKIFGWRVN